MLLALMATLLAINPAHADCNNHTPATGQTTTCSPPVADTIGVAAIPGSTNVSVNVLTGAAINVIGIHHEDENEHSARSN
jgi:hypothetical protein